MTDNFVEKLELGPEVIKLFSYSTQLSMKFFLLINVKMPTIVGILTFMNRKIAFEAYLSLKRMNFLIFLYLLAFKISCSAEFEHEKSFITSRTDVLTHQES